MVRVLTKAGFIMLMFFAVMAMPAQVSAQTISVSQTIIITARVMPARSIVVNEQGRMTKIFSNTNENVEPKVYLNTVPGEERPLTPQLKSQYHTIIAQQSKLNGVEIPVPPPLPPKTVRPSPVKVMSFLNTLHASSLRLPLLSLTV